MFNPKSKEPARLCDDPTFKREADILNRIYAERDSLRQEYSDLHDARRQRRQQAQPDGIGPEVAEILGETPDVVPDDSLQRMAAIQETLEATEKAAAIQERRVQQARQVAERKLRQAVKPAHQALAKEKLALMRQNRELYFRILRFEADRLTDLGFGTPLRPLVNDTDNFIFAPTDSSGQLDNAMRHERELEDYIRED